MAKISLIGSGKTATALGKALDLAGHSFVQVWSRSGDHAAELAARLNASPVTELTLLTEDADIYLLAVKDDAIATVADGLKIGHKIIAHTSGIKSKQLLERASPNHGVFYPFVSMTREAAVDFGPVLLMTEGSNEKTIHALNELGGSISGHVKTVAESQRRSMHLAAVFAHNFTNHMYVIAERMLRDEGLDFDTLRPLIASHAANVQRLSPSMLQTGPAIRHDDTTIAEHLRLLSRNNEFMQLYLMMTEAIQQWHKKDE